MDEQITYATTEIEKIADDAVATFGSLSGHQLNWKPAADSWSVAQCFDHLITINTLYFPLFEKMRSGTVSITFWEKYSPFSGFFGRTLIESMSPGNPKKMKTGKKAQPRASEIGSDIIALFRDHEQQLAEHMRNISPKLNLKETILTSPMLGFVTYSLDDCLTMLVVHEQRHFLQAKRITESQGFPANKIF